ncbi:MAG: TRIC cation channel family protein [Oscillospiraceae bacterium]|nr:TRIC cation channel family protein [Oscillospiraceae bacterium]MBO7423788.1 TRIC cation channel family protein [Oscillospiraceae bacterium]MBO7727593.1 TRIC cation channel family protein [Oscillospiraceae bacterium]MBP5168124.1 TRIC cation channel family protein [Oscillospiraceae bacterium]
MVFIFEFIGTVAFALSGADVGIRKKMDLFGVTILAMITAVGGGIIRDIILNVTPPAAFREPVFTLSAIAVGIFSFITARRHIQLQQIAICEVLLRTMDSIGLGLFTVVGVETAFVHVQDANIYLAVFVGVITGIGGGIFRDVLSCSTPFVFVKHFYACASLIGAVVCALCWPLLGSIFSMLIGAIIIFVLRNLAAHYRWSLPKIAQNKQAMKL